MAVDGAGNLVISDSGNDRVRVVATRTGTFYGQAMTAKHIYTVAGNGTYGFSGDGGPATAAELDTPDQTAVDGAGNLVIADSANDRVRVVAAGTGTFYGQAMTAGDIYTVAGNGTTGFSGDGDLATGAALDSPRGVTVDGAGNLVIADRGNNRVRVVAAGDRHLLRAGDDRRGHLHGGRHRHRRVLRRRRPGHRGRAGQPGPDGGGRRGEPGHRRRDERPGARRGGRRPAPSTGRR